MRNLRTSSPTGRQAQFLITSHPMSVVFPGKKSVAVSLFTICNLTLILMTCVENTDSGNSLSRTGLPGYEKETHLGFNEHLRSYFFVSKS